MTKFITLVRRELWEHANLWRLPLLLLFLGLLANLAFSGMLDWLDIVPPDFIPVEFAANVVDGTLRSLSGILYLLFSLLAAFYLSDCLHRERQDKSILFWRSLPTSDFLTVLAKFFIGVVLIPILLFATVIIIITLSLLFQTLFTGLNRGLLNVSLSELSAYWISFLGRLGVASLWTLPVYAWVLFCSSWSRRTPLLTAIVIPVIAVFVEKSAGLHIGIFYYIVEHLPISQMLGEVPGLAGAGFRFPRGVELATTPMLVGVVVAIALFCAAVWIRRWRDDSL